MKNTTRLYHRSVIINAWVNQVAVSLAVTGLCLSTTRHGVVKLNLGQETYLFASDMKDTCAIKVNSGNEVKSTARMSRRSIRIHIYINLVVLKSRCPL